MALPTTGQIPFNNSSDLTVYGSSTSGTAAPTISTAPDGTSALKFGPYSASTVSEIGAWTVSLDAVAGGLKDRIFLGFDVYIETTLTAVDVDFFAILSSAEERVSVGQSKLNSTKTTAFRFKKGSGASSFYTARFVEPTCVTHNKWYRVIVKRYGVESAPEGIQLAGTQCMYIYDATAYPQAHPLNSYESPEDYGKNNTSLKFQFKNISASAGNPITVYIKNFAWGNSTEFDALYGSVIDYRNTPAITTYTAGGIAFDASTPVNNSYYRMEHSPSSNDPVYNSGNTCYATGYVTANNLFNPNVSNHSTCSDYLTCQLPYKYKSIPTTSAATEDYRENYQSSVNIFTGNGKGSLWVGFDMKLDISTASNEYWDNVAIANSDTAVKAVGWHEIFRLGALINTSNVALSPVITLVSLYSATGVDRSSYGPTAPYEALGVQVKGHFDGTSYYKGTGGLYYDDPDGSFFDLRDWNRITVHYFPYDLSDPASGEVQVYMNTDVLPTFYVANNSFIAPNVISIGCKSMRRLLDCFGGACPGDEDADSNTRLLFKNVAWGPTADDAIWTAETIPPSSGSIFDNDMIGYQKGKRHSK